MGSQWSLPASGISNISAPRLALGLDLPNTFDIHLGKATDLTVLNDILNRRDRNSCEIC